MNDCERWWAAAVGGEWWWYVDDCHDSLTVTLFFNCQSPTLSIESYVKAVNQPQKELILSLGYDTSNWTFEMV